MVENDFELVHRTGTLNFGGPVAAANKHLLGSGWDAKFSDDDTAWERFSNVDVVIGCPPCSGWSGWTGPKERGADARAHEHTRAFIRYAAAIKPRVVVFESVQQAFTQGLAMMRDYRAMLEDLSGKPYDLHHVRMNNLMVGGHSYRPRYFWVAVEAGAPFGVDAEWPADSLPTLVDVIGDLADLPETWKLQPYQREASSFVQHQLSKSGLVDGHVTRDNVHTQRVADVFKALPNGNHDWLWGMDLANALKQVYDTHGGWVPESWNSKIEKIVSRDFYMGFSIPYRWRGDACANVLTGGALDLVVHPTHPRTITHREAARIMGLPDDWKIEPVKDYAPLQDVWGKAVALDASRWIGAQVRRHLDGQVGSFPSQSLGDREWLHHTDKGFSRPAMRKRYYPNGGAGVGGHPPVLMGC